MDERTMRILVSCISDLNRSITVFSHSDLTSLLIVQSESVQALWNTVAGGISTIATQNATGIGTYYTNQPASNIFDGKVSTTYNSRGDTIPLSAGLRTGFYVTIGQCQPTLFGFRFATTSSAIGRDPMSITIEGSDCAILINCTSWTLFYNGTTGLDSTLTRTAYGIAQTLPVPQTFTSYRFLVTAKRSSDIFVSYSEVELYGL
jgi:hypothetical protein